MNESQRVLNGINDLTVRIETDYPELYQFLNENPMTIPSDPHPNMSLETLQEYLGDLRELIKHHLETHKKGAL